MDERDIRQHRRVPTPETYFAIQGAVQDRIRRSLQHPSTGEVVALAKDGKTTHGPLIDQLSPSVLQSLRDEGLTTFDLLKTVTLPTGETLDANVVDHAITVGLNSLWLQPSTTRRSIGFYREPLDYNAPRAA